MDNKPLVSISCVTFNHVLFIRECIEGFLSQKTNFKYEVIIYDDASTDGTKEIIEEYVNKYPDIIHPVFQKENQYSKGIRGLRARFTYGKCNGKYIATCDGDDCWTDPYKLQKQVDFMEENDDYVVCGHDARVVDSKGEVVKDSKLHDQFKKDATSEELKNGFWLLSTCILYRNLPIFQNYPKEAYKVSNGDTFLISLLGGYGKYKFLSDIQPAIYRKHEGGVWSMKSLKERALGLLKTNFYIAKFQEKNDYETSLKIYDKILFKGHEMYVLGLSQKYNLLDFIKILKYTIYSHFKINGFFKTIIFSFKKIVRMVWFVLTK